MIPFLTLIENHTSIIQNEYGQGMQTLLVLITSVVMILGIIMFIQKVENDTLFRKRIILHGIKNKCCRPNNVIILDRYYQCKKCQRLFDRKT